MQQKITELERIIGERDIRIGIYRRRYGVLHREVQGLSEDGGEEAGIDYESEEKEGEDKIRVRVSSGREKQMVVFDWRDFSRDVAMVMVGMRRDWMNLRGGWGAWRLMM